MPVRKLHREYYIVQALQTHISQKKRKDPFSVIFQLPIGNTETTD